MKSSLVLTLIIASLVKTEEEDYYYNSNTVYADYNDYGEESEDSNEEEYDEELFNNLESGLNIYLAVILAVHFVIFVALIIVQKPWKLGCCHSSYSSSAAAPVSSSTIPGESRTRSNSNNSIFQ